MFASQRFQHLIFAGSLVSTSIYLASTVCFAAAVDYAGSAKDRQALQRTGDAIRSAFARGDVDEIMKYHHPDVIKALSSTRYLVGSDAVRKDLLRTLSAFLLHFDENRTENILFQGDTAVEESFFAIRGTPKAAGQPFLIKGRAMVVYVRYSKSPTGWASIREIIQPAQ